MPGIVDEARDAHALPSKAMRKAIREAAGVSQERLGRELGVHRMTVYRWEHGDRTPRGALRASYARLLRDLQEAVR